MRQDESESGRPSEPAADVAQAGALIGRGPEMAHLGQGLDDALGGRGGLFLVGGEPGIGKSRLADELAAMARERGAHVLWGRCWEAGGAPAYWPWVQVLRSHLRATDDAATDRDRGAHVEGVGQVVLELVQFRADRDTTSVTEADAARFGQFDAVTTYLTDAARIRPIVLILDDLQAADAPSLLLLRFLAGHLADVPMLVVGTYRSDEVAREPALAAALSDLTRQPTAQRLQLTGLDERDVGPFVLSVTGVQPSEAVAAAIHHETEGNPFFLTEISRLAAAESRLDEADPAYWERAVSQGVREVVGLRVSRLSRECARMLSVASVLGRDFAIEPLTQTSALDLEDLEELLDEAAIAGLITDAPGTPGLLRFSHAVIRDTLYDELPPSHRIRLHLWAGEALQTVDHPDPDARSAELAHHFFLAGPRAGVERIVECARNAAGHSLAVLAYEEAVRLYHMALTALGWADTADAETECDLQLALADAWSRAGDFVEARNGFLRAAELAKELGHSQVLARAALGYGGRFVWPTAAGEPHMLPLLEDALATLGDDDKDLEVRLRARLAGAKRDELERGPRDALSRDTVEIARRTGDRPLLAYALAGRHAAMLGPSHAPGGHERPDELIRIARETGNLELAFEGEVHRMLLSLEQGEVTAAVRVLDELDEISRHLHQPTQLWLAIAARASLTLLRGDLRSAEALIAEAARTGERAQNWEARTFADVQWFALRREQGRLDEMRARIEASVDAYPTRPLFSCLLAVLCLELDDQAGAAAILRELAHDEFGRIPLNNDWSLSMTLLAEVAHGLRDRQRSELLYELLLPAADTCVDTLELTTGAVSRSLGLLAATSGCSDDAVRHLDAAVATNERIGARLWTAHTHYALACALESRGASADRARARSHLERAAAVARELGQVALARRVEAALQSMDGPDGGDPVREPAPRPRERRGVFRCEGDYWLIGLDGTDCRLHDTKGLRHLATLIATPDREIHALDLVGASASTERSRAAVEGPDPDLVRSPATSEYEVLDRQAREAYRDRIETLQTDLDEAEAWNDAGRASELRAELEFLLHELAAASGMGGSSRAFGSAVERARVNATRAIRSAIDRIRRHDVELAWHLDRSVRTGTFCSYEHDREAPVAWTL